MKRSGSLVPLVLVAALLMLTGVSCNKVVKPSSDSTPPQLIWNVRNTDTNEAKEYPATATIAAKRGQYYVVTEKANNPGGVQSIEMNQGLSGEEVWMCTKSGPEPLGQTKTATFAPLKQTLAPDADGKVLTSIFLIQSVTLDMECPGGWTFSSGHLTLTGRATNYFGGETTGALTFKVTP